MKKIGFCKQCFRNVPHVLYFQWPIFRILNRFPTLAESLPFASWHCCGCEKVSFGIRRPNPESVTDTTSTDMSDVTPWPDRSDPKQRTGLFFRRKRKAEVDDDNTASSGSEKDDSVAERVGNFLRSDDSLLVRKARAARYSEKFREGVVDRILSGKATITQVRNELGLSERDVLDWINDRIIRKDQKIAKLSMVVQSVRQLAIEESLTDSQDGDGSQAFKVFPDPDAEQPRSQASQNDTIEGRVNSG